MPTQLSPINKTLENYTIKLVHVTLPETINVPCNVAFEVTDPRDNIPMIQLAEVTPSVLWNYFREHNLLHKRPQMASGFGKVTSIAGKRTWSRKKKNGIVGATGTG